MDLLNDCPFCGGKVNIGLADGEGNIKSADYQVEPASGLTYFVEHDDKENPKCPIANHYEDGGMVGVYLYDTVEELAAAWNERFEGGKL